MTARIEIRDGALEVVLAGDTIPAVFESLERAYRAAIMKNPSAFSLVLDQALEELSRAAPIAHLPATGQETRDCRTESAVCISTTVAARELGIDESTVRRHARAGKIPGARQSRPGRWDIPLEHLATKGS